jgi:hypothetical protein
MTGLMECIRFLVLEDIVAPPVLTGRKQGFNVSAPSVSPDIVQPTDKCSTRQRAILLQAMYKGTYLAAPSRITRCRCVHRVS